MKKIALVSLALASFVFANNQALKDKVSKVVSEKTQRDIQIKEIYDFQGSPNLKVAILEDKADKAEFPIFITADGNIILGLSNVFISSDPKDSSVLAEVYQKTQPKVERPKPEVLDKFFSSLKQNRYVTLKSNAKKPKETIYMVSDPRCPACQGEIAQVEEKLKNADVKILFVAFLGEESAIKASLIREKLIGVSSNADKLKIIRKISDRGYQLSQKDRMIDTKEVEKNNEDVAKVGIQSVPFEHAIKR